MQVQRMQAVKIVFGLIVALGIEASAAEVFPYKDAPNLRLTAKGTSAGETWTLLAYPSYRYDLLRQCYCSGPKKVTVYVIDGQVTRVVDLDTGETLSNKGAVKVFKTLAEYKNEWLSLLAAWPDRVEIRLNRQQGYPEKVFIDPSFFVADDEIDYRFSNVMPLKPL